MTAKKDSNAKTTKKTPAKTTKSKRMVLRQPNLKIQEKSARLREFRVNKEDLQPQRLQKLLAATGIGSRRDMEELIKQGRVVVNNKIAQIGDKVSVTDEVKVNNKVVKLIFPDRLPRIALYYKQEGELVTRNDPAGRATVFDRLPLVRNNKWIAIGRLDINTSGLLIFTTSGDLVNQFSHPRFAIDREYAVRVSGELTEQQMIALTTTGIELDDGNAKAAKIAARESQEESKNHWYEIVVQEGRNREVRRIFEHFGLTVSRLIRTRFGPIAIPPRLKKGQYYELNELEVEYVLKQIGMTTPNKKSYK